MTHLCPVCGYDKLQHPPEDYAICPCCRTEFGVSDASWTHDELRQDWIARGAKWLGVYVPEPPDYDPVQQLLNIGYIATEADKALIAKADADRLLRA